ncbi:MAG TPA: Gfo/Idh/MocA family oxidoreductase [Kofleriaceae bacterium]|nr:Gfo/Idh/MocA family oxidoreductase [Kofleriaceae bacterium]
MTRVAFAGAGGIAERHLGALQAVGGVDVVGVSSRTAERAAAFAGRCGARVFTDAGEMLDAVKPDALYVCVTPAAHGDIERAAIARRVPFFVEKPLALDWDTAAAIGAEVARAELVTSVGYQWRHHASVERARELLAGRSVALAMGYWLTRTPAPAWWSRSAESGGQMVEQLTHMVDLARWFLGPAASVHALTQRVPRTSHPDCDVDEVTLATVRFRSGAVASFTSTCILAASHKVGLHLYAENIAVEIGAASLTVDTGAGREEQSFEGDATVEQARAFLEAVTTGDRTRVRSSYADALDTHRITMLARDSARQGGQLMSV